MSQTNSIIKHPGLCFPICGGLKVGYQITICGRVSDFSTRFSFNLKKSDLSDMDIAFHFNPRNNEQTVVRNTFHNGAWGKEERSIPSFEFNNGSRFAIRCLVQENCYSVFVNGKHYIDYNHRLSIADVRFLELTTGAHYDAVKIQIPVAVPLKGYFPRHFERGDAFRVRGVVKDGSPNRFAINLETAESNNIALHVNPRVPEKDVVFNSMTNGSWGPEQRGKWSPQFEPSQYFDIFIVAEEDCFVICVNGKYFTSYNHRQNVSDIGSYSIKGDIILMSVDFCENQGPYQVKELSSALEVGDVCAVRGYFHGNRFQINLLNNHGANALHFNPRREGENQIVFNAKVNRSWQAEERIPLPGGLEAGEKSPFLVEIVYLGTHYDCYLNGHKIYTFNDRNERPVTGVHCKGDAYFYESLIWNEMNSPRVDAIPKPLQTGNWVSVMCMPDTDSDRFAINLQDTDEDVTTDNIHFHFNPRFDEGPVTVCNTFTNGRWGPEERRTSNFPFAFLERYEVNILASDTHYRVFVNGKHYLNYAYRLDRSHLSYMRLYAGAEFYPPTYHY